MKEINRREALKYAGYFMGGAISAPVVLSILNGCSAKPDVGWMPTYFTKDQAGLITRIVDTILPRTDTPAASELGVPGFIEEMVFVVNPSTKEEFLQGLAKFDADCEKETGAQFQALSDSDQVTYLTKRNAAIADESGSGRSGFFYKLKELTVTGYFTTEIAMTKILRYEPIPGDYTGCIPLDGPVWAT